MKLIYRTELNNTELAKIYDLIQIGVQTDGFQYDLYTGDDSDDNEDFFVLCYFDDELIGFLSCFNADIPEISGIVHPEFRRRKVFSLMFDAALEKITDMEIVFSGKEAYSGFAETAISLGGTNPYQEYLLKWNGATLFPSNIGILCDISIEGTETGQYESFAFLVDECEAGRCNLFSDSSTINIFDVYIEPEFRGLGYGKAMLNQLLSYISERDNREIILQVSEKNKPACNLYFANGFEIIDSVLFYSRLV